MADEVATAPTPPATEVAQPALTAPPPATPPATEQQPPAAPPAPPAAPEPAKGYWPDDWRQKAAGEDEKALRMLERYADPAAALKAGIELRRQRDGGQLRAPRPAADARPEEIAAWRKENGIPEKPDDYKIELPSGLVPGEEDKPLIASFLSKVHGADYTPAQAAQALDWYYETLEAGNKAQEAKDGEMRRKTEDALREDWGGDYRPNISVANQTLAEAYGPFAEQMASARLADGTLLGDHPEFIKGNAKLGRELNPAHTIVPGGGANQGKGIADEIATIMTVMRTDPARYWNDEKMQARLRELNTAQEKVSQRSAA